MEKRLTAFIDSINIEDCTGPRDSIISALHYDSRRVEKGSLFFALPGMHTDGKLFIDDAVRRGAQAVVYEGKTPAFHPGIAYVRVANTRTAMSRLSAFFYDYPSSSMNITGITGTDGKSTTVSFIHQLLEHCGQKSGFLSTVQFNTGTGTTHNYLRQSTPEAPEIHALLAEMRNKGVRFAIVEATSHGLSPKTARLLDVRFSNAVLTNISHEHLEFHGSFLQYKKDKARLFENIQNAIINADDPESGFFSSVATDSGAALQTYSMGQHPDADFIVRSYREENERIYAEIVFLGKEHSIQLPLVGAFNLENYAAAFLAVCKSAGCSPDVLAEGARFLRPVAGRMHVIASDTPFRVIVDYAHTPGAFSKVLPFIQNRTRGRLIAVFGSAGERDMEKRPIQGEIADRFCDCIILADEDPRNEDAMTILEAIAEGCRNKERGENLFLIPDRRKAIRKAYSLAETEDTVILLGKGHEKSIIYAEGPIKWDEAAIAGEILKEFTPWRD